METKTSDRNKDKVAGFEERVKIRGETHLGPRRTIL